MVITSIFPQVPIMNVKWFIFLLLLKSALDFESANEFSVLFDFFLFSEEVICFVHKLDKWIISDIDIGHGLHKQKNVFN